MRVKFHGAEQNKRRIDDFRKQRQAILKAHLWHLWCIDNILNILCVCVCVYRDTIEVQPVEMQYAELCKGIARWYMRFKLSLPLFRRHMFTWDVLSFLWEPLWMLFPSDDINVAVYRVNNNERSLFKWMQWCRQNKTVGTRESVLTAVWIFLRCGFYKCGLFFLSLITSDEWTNGQNLASIYKKTLKWCTPWWRPWNVSLRAN